MSTPLNPDASVLANLMESHFKELDLIPEQFPQKKEEMVPILENCLSHSCLEECLADQIAPGPVDSAFIKDCVAQVLVASNKRFIKIMHSSLVQAGKEKEAQKYLEKVLKEMEDMGLDINPSSFFMPPAPPEVFPTPAPGWRPGQGTADGI
ncbi:uncharacterized protein LOC110751751 [Prunus avium]|uniref:Uncharacterized protein LOC110751751 n=1 Tax=Prunus avium TaxID=42229 RepID=A0A6P5S3B6_PRUAV|nr:uncharacterized protein LOC110751751 [Prunus avium]